jgi:hypothetical protein
MGLSVKEMIKKLGNEIPGSQTELKAYKVDKGYRNMVNPAAWKIPKPSEHPRDFISMV